MKFGFFIAWITATCVALAFAVKPQSLHLGVEGADKIVHLAVFIALTLIPVITFDKIRNVLFGLLFLLAFGIAIELFQHYIPTRRAEVMDVVFDTIGIMVGAGIGFSLRATYQSFLPRAYVEAYIRPQS